MSWKKWVIQQVALVQPDKQVFMDTSLISYTKKFQMKFIIKEHKPQEQ